MKDREKAIVMAYTGICMLTGDKFQIFHKYVEDIMGRPIMTHEIGFLEGAIKKKAEADFMALCEDESSSENPNRWIPCSERLPEEPIYKGFVEPSEPVLIQLNSGGMKVSRYWGSRERYKDEPWIDLSYPTTLDVIAWMPLPEPYKAEMESEE